METTSPETSRRSPGMPWTISLFTDAQIVAGNEFRLELRGT
jgi:hypothetical protein